jgi:hypothetical protein
MQSRTQRITNAAPRVTQRAPRSCYPCSKRKMRCSKTIPCHHCIRRNITEQCAREAVVLSKTLPDGLPSTPGALQHIINSAESRDDRRYENSSAHDGGTSTSSTLTSTASSSPNAVGALSSAHLIRRHFGVSGWNSTSPVISTTTAMAGISSSCQSPQAPNASFRNAVNQSTLIGSISSQRPAESHIEMEAANSLETLAWGSHKNFVEMNHGRNWALRIQGSLSSPQEREVLQFHQNHVAWTHNVLHMPTFIDECELHRQTQQSLPRVGWLSLYYAVLSVSRSSF